MKQVFVVEGDNNENYSDHQNWFICVANSLEAAEQDIRKKFSEYHPSTEHPVRDDSSVLEYHWDLYHYKWSDCITAYIHLENILGEE